MSDPRSKQCEDTCEWECGVILSCKLPPNHLGRHDDGDGATWGDYPPPPQTHIAGHPVKFDATVPKDEIRLGEVTAVNVAVPSGGERQCQHCKQVIFWQEPVEGVPQGYWFAHTTGNACPPKGQYKHEPVGPTPATLGPNTIRTPEGLATLGIGSQTDKFSTLLDTKVTDNLRDAIVSAEATKPQRDECEICFGELGGVPGNENVIEGVTVCDYCSVFFIRFAEAKKRREVAAPVPPTQNLLDLLRDANEVCRSAHEIAKRKGEATNWDAWTKRVSQTLKLQHVVLSPNSANVAEISNTHTSPGESSLSAQSVAAEPESVVAPSAPQQAKECELCGHDEDWHKRSPKRHPFKPVVTTAPRPEFQACPKCSRLVQIFTASGFCQNCHITVYIQEKLIGLVASSPRTEEEKEAAGEQLACYHHDAYDDGCQNCSTITELSSRLAAKEAEISRLTADKAAWVNSWSQQTEAGSKLLERIAELEAVNASLTQTLKTAMPYIEFYAKREMESPSNNSEAVRETREMLHACRASLAKGEKA